MHDAPMCCCATLYCVRYRISKTSLSGQARCLSLHPAKPATRFCPTSLGIIESVIIESVIENGQIPPFRHFAAMSNLASVRLCPDSGVSVSAHQIVCVRACVHVRACACVRVRVRACEGVWVCRHPSRMCVITWWRIQQNWSRMGQLCRWPCGHSLTIGWPPSCTAVTTSALLCVTGDHAAGEAGRYLRRGRIQGLTCFIAAT